MSHRGWMTHQALDPPKLSASEKMRNDSMKRRAASSEPSSIETMPRSRSPGAGEIVLRVLGRPG